MNCPNCNKEINDTGYAFCPFCGEILPEPKETEKICPNCSSVVEKDHAFCPLCGTKIEQSATHDHTYEQHTNNKLHCPKCYSIDLVNATESNVTSGLTFTQNKISSTTFSNAHKHFWLCKNCGEKFRNISNLKEEIEALRQSQNGVKVPLYILLVASVLFGILAFNIENEIFNYCFFFSIIAFLIICVITLCVLNSTDKRIETLEKELEYLNNNCFK